MSGIGRRIRRAVVRKQNVLFRDPRYNNVVRVKQIYTPNFQTAASVAAASIFTQLGLDHLIPDQAPRGAKSSIASSSNVKRKFTGDRIGATPQRQKQLSTPFMAPTATAASTKSSAAAPSRSAPSSSAPSSSFSNSSRARTMPQLGKRKRAKRYKRALPRMTRQKFASTSSSRLAQGSSMRNKITVINKLMTGITPIQETGGTIVSSIQTYISETTPNGSFSLAWSFKLTDYPNYADYTDVYQWYKILSVKVHFYPLNNSHPSLREGDATNPLKQSTVSGTSYLNTSLAPTMVFAKDQQSAALFSSESVAMQHAGAQFHAFNDGRELTVYIAPKATGLLGTAGSEAIYEHKQPQWITTNDATVPHYGLRTYWNMAHGNTVRVIMEMKVAFKQPKI